MFGEKLKQIMKEKKITIVSVKEKTGLSQGYISDVRKGVFLPSEKKLNLIFDVLNLAEDELELLKKEWSLDKSGNEFRDIFIELNQENKNLKSVLKRMTSEKKLLEEIDELKIYKEIYELIFGILTPEEIAELINQISEKLEIIAYRKGNYEKVKEKIDILNKLIKEI